MEAVKSLNALGDQDQSITVSANGKVVALPSPEDVFLAWTLHLPAGADIATLARREIARIERKAPLRPELARLRDLFLEAIAFAQR